MTVTVSKCFRLAALAFGLLCSASAMADGGAAPPLRFALIGVHSPERLAAMWGPLLADLSASVGAPVTPQFHSDYAGVVWSLKAGDVDIAWVGNKGAIQAVDVAGAAVFAQRIDLQGGAEYRSYLIVRAASGLESFAAVRAAGAEAMRRDGRFVIAFGDPNSTSGAVVPWYYLFHRNGLGFPDLFTAVIRGSHEENYFSVARGDANVGVVSSATFDRMCVIEPAACAALRVIWESPAIPADPLVWRADLDETTKTKVAAFFFDYGRERADKNPEALARERERLALLPAAGFRPSDNSQMATVREIDIFRASRGKSAGAE